MAQGLRLNSSAFLTFHDAGHILGSSIVELKLEGLWKDQDAGFFW